MAVSHAIRSKVRIYYADAVSLTPLRHGIEEAESASRQSSRDEAVDINALLF